MKFKTTFRLFLLVCVLGAVLLLARYRSGVAERLRDENSILALETEEVAAISLSAGTNSVELIRRGEGWFILSSVRARADAAEVARVLDTLDALEITETITGQQRRGRGLTLTDYGLAAPRASIMVATERESCKIRIGDDAALARGSVYINVGDSEDVITVSGKVLALLPRNTEALRDRSVVRGSAPKTVRLEIERRGGGFIQLSRQNGRWFLQQPISARADSASVERRLDVLYALRVEEFFWDSSVEGASANSKESRESKAKAQIESCGLALDASSLRIAVWTEGDSLGQELLLGKPVQDGVGGVFAKRREIGSIYTVDSRIVEEFTVAPGDLRDHAIFDIRPSLVKYACLMDGEKKLVLKDDAANGWGISDPVQWRADEQIVRERIEKICDLTVESFIEGSAANLEELGLAPPRYALLLDAGDGSEDSDSMMRGHLLIAPVDGKSIHARMDGGDELFRIAADSLAWITNNCVDPLAYRDRVMLALKPGDVHSITLKLNGSEQCVVRDDADEWVPFNGERATVNHDAVGRTLLTVNNLRALRIEARNPESLVTYGLDDPSMVLTFGLQGEAGIEKSLMTGFRSRTDGIFAMVRGQDIVFVLEAGLVDRLASHVLNEPIVTKSSAVSVGAATEEKRGPEIR